MKPIFILAPAACLAAGIASGDDTCRQLQAVVRDAGGGGVLVVGVEPGGAGERSGLRPGDRIEVISRVAGEIPLPIGADIQTLPSVSSLVLILDLYSGHRVQLEAWRDDEPVELTVTVRAGSANADADVARILGLRSPRERQVAVEALARTGGLEHVAALEDASSRIRGAGNKALTLAYAFAVAMLGDPSKADLLLFGLEDKSHNDQTRGYLVALGPRARPQIHRWLEDRTLSSQIRGLLCEVVAETTDATAFAILERLQSDADAKVADAARRARSRLVEQAASAQPHVTVSPTQGPSPGSALSEGFLAVARARAAQLSAELNRLVEEALSARPPATSALKTGSTDPLANWIESHPRAYRVLAFRADGSGFGAGADLGDEVDEQTVAVLQLVANIQRAHGFSTFEGEPCFIVGHSVPAQDATVVAVFGLGFLLEQSQADAEVVALADDTGRVLDAASTDSPSLGALASAFARDRIPSGAGDASGAYAPLVDFEGAVLVVPRDHR